MSELKDGQKSAFGGVEDVVWHDVHNALNAGTVSRQVPGAVTLRDYFAAAALQGLLGYVSIDDWRSGCFVSGGTYADAAYDIADAMLRKRRRAE